MSITASDSANTILPSPDVAKDARDHLRFRQQLLKQHDRSKSKRKAPPVTSLTTRGGPNGRREPPSSEVKDPDAWSEAAPSSRPRALVWEQILEHNGGSLRSPTVEVPLMSLFKPTKPKYVFGSDFEIVSRPQRVIVLDDMDEDDDQEWEYVPSPLSPMKLPTAFIETAPRTSYAAVLKG